MRFYRNIIRLCLHGSLIIMTFLSFTKGMKGVTIDEGKFVCSYILIIILICALELNRLKHLK